MDALDVCWPDATLDRVEVTYDAVLVRVVEDTGRARTVRCEGHVGHRLCGFWDEVIIERADLVSDHAFVQVCVDDLARRRSATSSDSGNAARNTHQWTALIVSLIDGARLEVVAARYTVD